MFSGKVNEVYSEYFFIVISSFRLEFQSSSYVSCLPVSLRKQEIFLQSTETIPVDIPCEGELKLENLTRFTVDFINLT